jgi:anti-sigma regulatory factor (Ser/Thr protein kinase)
MCPPRAPEKPPCCRVCFLDAGIGHAGVVEYTARFAAAIDSVPAARHFVAQWLRDEECDIDLAAEIAVTELAANAVLHAGTGFTVGIERQGDTTLIEVTDGSPEPPVLRDPDEGGMGLRLVDAVTIEWGVRPIPGTGKAVYVRLPR